MTPPLVRIAPSPTGFLHVGNVRTGLINWLFARQHGGRFMLRLDDTDQSRSKPEYARAIEEDLRWLGMGWDLFDRQFNRLARYEEAAAQLKQDGWLYPCFETDTELQLKRKTQLARGLPPLYDRAALALPPAEVAARLSAGEKPHWRFKLQHKEVAWDDLAQGPKSFHGANLSDPVLIREDGVPLYTFCSVVDDADYSVTHIIRGEDHVANTAVQIQIFWALKAPVPRFAHLPLLTGASGEELSKRLGTLSIRQLRDDYGLEAEAVVAYLGRLGTPEAAQPGDTLQSLARDFAFEKLGRAPPKFDIADLQRVNARLLHHLDFVAAAPRLARHGIQGVDETLWLALRSALTRITDIREWIDILQTPLSPIIEDRAVADAAAQALPAIVTPENFADWVAAIRTATGKKGPQIFMPLRHALTGRTDGPELKFLLPLMDRARLLARLQGQTA